MTNEEILAAFVRPTAFPEQAVALAQERREEIAPLLIAEIEAWSRGWKDVEGYYYLADFACHLLAEWRDTRGFKVLIALAASPNHEILGDTITEGLSSLLARLYDGDAEDLKGLVLNPSADEFVRDSALEAYVLLVEEGAISREDAHGFLLQILSTMPHKPDYAWCGWARAVSGLIFEDLAPKVRELCDEEAIDITWMDYEDFEGDLEDARKGLVKSWRRQNESPIEAMRRWRYVEPGKEYVQDDDEPSEEELLLDFDAVPAVNPYRDFGRNDPCPCGSGTKFKKCCLPKVQAGLI